MLRSGGHTFGKCAPSRLVGQQGFAGWWSGAAAGGHDLRQAVASFSTRHADWAHAFLPQLSYHAICCRIGDPANPGGHAEALATSLALHLQPDMVRREVIAWTPPVAGGPEQPAA
jgi:creatinine amidohydrolase/Fe(II)-dependent formamide hydrolase-like protein